MLIEALKVIAPIIIITSFGYIYGKFRTLNLKTLADLIIYFGSPALVFTQLAKQQIIIAEFLQIILSVLFVVLGSGFVAWLIFRFRKRDLPTSIYLPIMFMNSGFIGYPLALFAFGQFGLNRAILFNTVNAILVFKVRC